MYSDVAVIIPARIGSERLPNKPLEIIGNKSMIEHVALRIKATGIKNTYVATDSKEIAHRVKNSGVVAIMTDQACPTGTDRVYQAFQKIEDQGKINYIINVQGDMPFVASNVIVDIIAGLKKFDYDIMTPVVKVGRDIADSASNVKVVIDKNMRALYFSRSIIPYNGEDFLYHVGIYGFRREALEMFVKLKQTPLEKTEKLEQLRALENGMKIGVCYANEVPISVDTLEDLSKARAYFAQSNSHKII